jgi:hypothetical protein
VKKLQEQDGASTRKMEELLQDLLDIMTKLDLSIDYLASSVTGQDPFEIGLSQSALGRVVGKAGQAQGGSLKENKKMKITKSKLKNIIQEIINEVEFHGETPAGQLYDTEEEDARFTQHLAWEKELKPAGLDQREMSVVFKALEDPDAAADFYGTSAYEKLFDYYAFSDTGESKMPYGVAKARTGMPDEWIINYLTGLGSAPGGESPVAKNPPQHGGWDPLNTGKSKRRTPGPGPYVRRESVTSEEKKKITKAELKTVVEEELKAVLEKSKNK